MRKLFEREYKGPVGRPLYQAFFELRGEVLRVKIGYSMEYGGSGDVEIYSPVERKWNHLAGLHNCLSRLTALVEGRDEESEPGPLEIARALREDEAELLRLADLILPGGAA